MRLRRRTMCGVPVVSAPAASRGKSGQGLRRGRAPSAPRRTRLEGRLMFGVGSRTAAAAVLVCAAAGPADAADQVTGRAGPCPAGAGVTVVVDFQDLGGGTVVRCAPGEQRSGLAALRAAGFRPTGTARWGDAF